MDTIPVLIIGAGPTGLMLALELSLFKIPFRIISAQVDKRPYHETRALAIHSRTLELLARHGLAERMIAIGCPFTNMKMYMRGQLLSTKNPYPGYLMGDTSYKFTVSINQMITEKLLEQRLIEYGVQVERGMIAEKVTIDEDRKAGSVWVRHVSKVAGSSDEEEKVEVIKAKYIIGCDGAHSIVRKSVGIKFNGASYNEEYILADVHVEWDYEKCPHFFVDKGYIALFPMDKDKNIFRVVCRRPISLYSAATPTITKETTESTSSQSSIPHSQYRQPDLSDFSRIMTPFIAGKFQIHTPTWFSSFHINRRLASTFRLGPIILAGDAAHVHAPFGGQGMNTGMQDSVNLGWKLARVLSDTAPESLLDSYESERRRIAQNVINRANSQYLMMSTSNPIRIWLRNFFMLRVFPLFSWAKLADKNIRRVSQLAIRYRHSSIVGNASSWRGNLRGGDRVPDGWLVNGMGKKVTLHSALKEPNDHLLLFGSMDQLDSSIFEEALEDIESCSSELIVVKIYNHQILDEQQTDAYADPEGKIHADFQFTKPGYILVRPDGYISFIGPLDSLGELQSWVLAQTKV